MNILRRSKWRFRIGYWLTGWLCLLHRIGRLSRNNAIHTKQDKKLNIWSIASGKHVRAYKVETPAPPSTGRPGGVHGTARGWGAKGSFGTRVNDEGSELFKVDLDPTGMYAATCSFDKVRGHFLFWTTYLFLIYIVGFACEPGY